MQVTNSRVSRINGPMSLTQAIKQQAQKLGFELVGVAPVGPVPELNFYKKWIEDGHAGEMTYLQRNAEKKLDIKLVVPEAKSVLVCGKIYHTDKPLSVACGDVTRGWISRYGWGDDYHDILTKKLFDLVDFLKSETGEQTLGRVYTDTGPIIDRVYAKYAGIGWYGKNTCIINQEKGSWFFLGEIITNLELEYDEPAPDRCGSCQRCIDACPTDALLEPYLLDARRCISYLTIELKGAIPESMRDGIGNHIYGCDICQDVCPWNKKAEQTTEAYFMPRQGLFNPDLTEVGSWTMEDFRLYLRRNPIKRTKFRGLMRNVAVAMGNSGKQLFLPVLRQMAKSDEPLITEHAVWAINKIEITNR